MANGFSSISKACTVLVLALLGLYGCKAGEAPASGAAATPAASAKSTQDAAPSARKVIRKAELSLEVASAARAQVEVARIAERNGGYVASTTRNVTAESAERSTSGVNLTLRVPAEKLSSVLEQVKRLGTGAETERISSEDATDEYVDLEARIENQRRLEQQFLEILKTARTVSDALNVQRELAGVRTDIDRMEGRRRFIAKEAALSSIELELTTARPLVRASLSDFSNAARDAYSDSINVGAGLIAFGIRFVGVSLPLLVVFGLPLMLGAIAFRRHQRRKQSAELG
jgi:Domain of unknown function (DUF4349)